MMADDVASDSVGNDPLSAPRPTFLLILLAVTLLHVRLARPVFFGRCQWMISAPAFVAIVGPTAIAGVFVAGGLSFSIGLLAYSGVIALLSATCLLSLTYTLMNIKRNLATDPHEKNDEAWPPVRHTEENLPRPSFSTEEIDALRDGGASWITSEPGSRRASTALSITRFPAKSAYWFRASTPAPDAVPPVPPLPSPFGSALSPTGEEFRDGDPFRRDVPTTPQEHPVHQRWRFGSQTSWLTSTDGSHKTMSAWSWSTRSPNVATNLQSATAVSRPTTPAMASAQVLGGYGYAPEGNVGSTTTLGNFDSVNVSTSRSLLWLVTFFIPLSLAIPYLVSAHNQGPIPPVAGILIAIAIALPSPLLALNLLLRAPVPIPVGLFESNTDFSPERPVTPGSTVVGRFSHEYKQSGKRSMSTCPTVVEGRRSGDIWISKGEAVEGKGKIGRALEMLYPKPKLSVMPLEGRDDREPTPPLPIQEDPSLPLSVHNTPRSETSAQWGRLRRESRTSSHLSGVEESMGHAAKIMVAQRHYSTMAQTYKVSSSPGRVNLENASITSGVEVARRMSGHLRTRSANSIIGPQTPTYSSFDHLTHVSPSPPPSFPIPPTPPKVRAARLSALKHKKSFSSGYSFGPVDNMNEIDALTAGVLPLLVPGLNIGENMVIKDGKYSPPHYKSTQNKKASRLRQLEEFGGDFSSPQIHSTPARTREPRGRKNSAFKHFSLPSLNLGKDGIHSLSHWTAEVGKAIEMKAGQIMATPNSGALNYRNTVFGADSLPSMVPHIPGSFDASPPALTGGLTRGMSIRRLGLRAEVPHGVNTARSSIASIGPMPGSSASDKTFVEEEILAELDSGPQAESTPHNHVTSKKRGGSRGTEGTTGRSSIVYVKSSDPPSGTPITPGSRSRVVPKAHRRLPPLPSSISPDSGSISGLRPLSLLKSRDTNTDSPNDTPSSNEESLSLKGKGKGRMFGSRSSKGENARPNKNLKNLSLIRSETAKLRGLLRKDEVLPNVVVRPPSQVQENPFTYSFR
ncbi:hypothetical protein DL96DRAFT_1592192 [Flagelloscypha sp. PMI_526]|nr:hypothetical protein DL96DRAFT_1592192 [Flagelloscypha sp. PMI_526]